MSMDMNKLAERLNKLTNKGGGKNVWLKLNEEDQEVRILPYKHQDDNIPFIEVYFHYDIAGHRSIPCPEKTLGEPCPICKVAEEIRSMGGKDNWEIFKNMQAKLRTYAPVIVRGKEEEGVKLWGFGKIIYEELLSTCIDEGRVDDLKKGHDLTVKQLPKGHPSNDTSFPKPMCKVQFKETPAMTDVKKLKAIINDIPNYLEDEEVFKFSSYEELSAIVAKLGDEPASPAQDSPAEETVVVKESTPTQAPASSNEDLASQLDDLLAD